MVWGRRPVRFLAIRSSGVKERPVDGNVSGEWMRRGNAGKDCCLLHDGSSILQDSAMKTYLCSREVHG